MVPAMIEKIKNKTVYFISALFECGTVICAYLIFINKNVKKSNITIKNGRDVPVQMVYCMNIGEVENRKEPNNARFEFFVNSFIMTKVKIEPQMATIMLNNSTEASIDRPVS